MPNPFATSRVRGLNCHNPLPTSQLDLYTRFIQSAANRKRDEILPRITPYLRGKILDIGMGAGAITCGLLRRGYHVDTVDVANTSIYQDLTPTIYDGHQLPYRSRHYGTALLIHVLHHCGRENLSILAQAKRVARRVIVIEDTYTNPLEHAFTSLNDMLGNFEFYSHHYLRPEEWDTHIRLKRWQLLHLSQFTQATYGIPTRYCMFVIE